MGSIGVEETIRCGSGESTYAASVSPSALSRLMNRVAPMMWRGQQEPRGARNV
jgi:hypothetical protein